MTVFLREILKTYLYTATVLLFVSLSSLSPIISSVFPILSFLALATLFLLRVFTPQRAWQSCLFPWLSLLLIWLALQQVAIHSGLPFFDVPSYWATWIEFFGMFASAVVLALVAEEIFSERQALYSYLKFMVFFAGVTAVYFIYLFYTSGVPVEKIKPPFLWLEHLGPLGAVNLQPNNLIDLFIPPFFFAMAFVFYHHRRKLSFPDPSQAYTEIILNLCFACVLSAALFFTKSRAGILAFIVALIIFSFLFAISQRRRRHLWKFILFILITGVIFLSTLGMKDIFREIMTLKETYLHESQMRGLRSLTMGASWQLVQERGLFGVGLGNLQMGWVFLHKPPFTAFPERSYNDPLWIWAEIGLPGFLLLLGVFVRTVFAGVRDIFKSESSFVTYLSAAAIAASIAFAAHSMVDPTFYVNALLYQIAIVLGILAGLRHLELEETRDKRLGFPKVRKGVRSIVFAGVVLGLVGYSAVHSSLQLAAAYVAGKSPSLDDLEEASRLDQSSSFYLRQLASEYAALHVKNSSVDYLEKAVNAIDLAIVRDPLNVSLYRRRAEILFEAGYEKRGEQSFQLMQEKLPDFYLGYISMTAFYLNEAIMSHDPAKADRYKAQGIRHYQKALELNPRISRHREVDPHFSAPALQVFRELLDDKSLS